MPSSQQDWFMENEYFSNSVVWSGYFSFSSRSQLQEALALGGGFEHCVLRYDKKKPLVRNVDNSWQDLGHLATYYLARKQSLVTRSFNNLEYKDGLLVKSGERVKMSAEFNWYSNVPLELKRFFPKIMERDGSGNLSSYSLEYLPLTTLSEILVFGNHHTHFWNGTFRLLGDFLKTCGHQAKFTPCQTGNEKWLDTFSAHVLGRIKLLKQVSGSAPQDLRIQINGLMSPSIQEIASRCLEIVGQGDPVATVIHGDLCLGNVLFESRLNEIRLIDPRGLDFEGDETICGDQRYDLAKLAQSFIGQYDFIIANRFELDVTVLKGSLVLDFLVESSDEAKRVGDAFFDEFLNGKKYQDEVLALMVLLFLTMGPLHSESPARQLAFLSNGAYLFNRFFGDSF
jgi:hypothetical protein